MDAITMTQLLLFDELPAQELGSHRTCTPYRCGSGPVGEKCGTCRFLHRVTWHNKRYLKCGHMAQHWTHGKGSDIKAKWLACRAWRPKDYDESVLIHMLCYPGDMGGPVADGTTESILVIADWYADDGQERNSEMCIKLAQTTIHWQCARLKQNTLMKGDEPAGGPGFGAKTPALFDDDDDDPGVPF